jgi:glycosyltransferase involved in cell wall biosynthesis
MKTSRAIRVCLDVRLGDGNPGGLEQAIIGLAHAFSGFDKGGVEEYLFVVDPRAADRLHSYISGPCSLLPAGTGTWRGRARRRLRQVPGLPDLRRRISVSRAPVPVLLPSDGTVEAADAHIVHFLTQGGFQTGIPSIYQPHDLQHLHFPEFFTSSQRAFREASYSALALQARKVVAMTRWGASDIAEHLGVPCEKLAVVPWASVLEAYGPPSRADLSRVCSKYSLPPAFALFPAQTWPHKNHLRLLEALAELRRQDVIVPLVAIGHENDFYRAIEERVHDLGLEESVRFLGVVDAFDVSALYHLARCLVLPSLFEGWGLPLSEALAAEVPAACSDLPVLREQAGDACLWFDPTDPRSIADSLRQVWIDERTRRELASEGRKVADRYSWARTARMFRALYRNIAGAELTTDDTALLAETSLAGRAVLEATA